MGRQKQRKFAELETFSNYYDGSIPMKGRWKSDYFNNDHPLVLELGCGKGEYTFALGKEFKETNFVGIDLKGVRLWAAAKKALEEELKNVFYFKLNIDHITEHFAEGEVDEIWIPFPDPYPKPSKWKKRLISSVFLKRYKMILKKGGLLHFKTDNTPLYEFALRTIKEEGFTVLAFSVDLYQSEILDKYNSIPTYFESIFMEKGETIKYIHFMLE